MTFPACGAIIIRKQNGCVYLIARKYERQVANPECPHPQPVDVMVWSLT